MELAHPDRLEQAAALDALDPATEWAEIYRRFTLWEHPHETRLGFQLAFYAPLSVPRMAKLLRRTGHFVRTPTKRAYDTGLLMYEIIAAGFDGDRAEQVIDLLNRLHGRHRAIRQEDMTYVLCSLVVDPIRMVDRAGWRASTQAEKDATVRWYAELARRINVERYPSSYAEAEAWCDDYRARHVRPSDDGAYLAGATMQVLRRRMPAPARPFVGPITAAVVGDRALVEALGFGPYCPALVLALNCALKVRAGWTRLLPPRSTPIFQPGGAAGVAYPEGYTLDQLGPDTAAGAQATA